MVTSFNIKYSIAAALRIMQARLSKFGKVAVVEKLLRVRGRLFNAIYRIRFGSKLYRWACFLGVNEFDKHFTDRRKEEAKKLITHHHESGDFVEVFNPEKLSCYRVFYGIDSLDCECEDYKNQVKFNLEKPLCKHGWAVLEMLGYQDIEAYIGNNQWEIDVSDARAYLGF